MNFVSDSTPSLERSKFALSGLVSEVELDVLSDHELGPELAWRVEIDEGIEIEADREQLFRVLSNLARNAREAGAPQITILARLGNGRLVVDVSDDGPGIPARIKEKLFEPFAGSAKAGGTGLGLVIARDIMKAHGGDLRLVETRENGTVFQMELPLGSGLRQAS